MKKHRYECIDRKIVYTCIDNKLYRIYNFFGTIIYMPMNSAEEERQNDLIRKAMYNGKYAFPSISETTDPDEMRDLEFYNQQGRSLAQNTEI